MNFEEKVMALLTAQIAVIDEHCRKLTDLENKVFGMFESQRAEFFDLERKVLDVIGGSSPQGDVNNEALMTMIESQNNSILALERQIHELMSSSMSSSTEPQYMDESIINMLESHRAELVRIDSKIQPQDDNFAFLQTKLDTQTNLIESLELKVESLSSTQPGATAVELDSSVFTTIENKLENIKLAHVGTTGLLEQKIAAYFESQSSALKNLETSFASFMGAPDQGYDLFEEKVIGLLESQERKLASLDFKVAELLRASSIDTRQLEMSIENAMKSRVYKLDEIFETQNMMKRSTDEISAGIKKLENGLSKIELSHLKNEIDQSKVMDSYNELKLDILKNKIDLAEVRDAVAM